MSFKNTPITAKIKRTTQGGMVQQPILNMGGPVKMKASSPAKQGGRSNKRNRGAVSASKPSIKDTTSKQEMLKKEISHMSSAMENYQKKGGEKNDSDARYLKKAKDKLAALQGGKTLTPKNLKARSEGEAGWAADDKARKNKTGIYKPTSKKSYDQAYKDRDKKTYGKMDKADYIKEAKRQNASKKAGKGYDVKGKGKDTPPRKKAVASTITPVGIKKVEISTKLDPKALKSQVAKVNAKAEPKKEVKKTRSQKLRSKGEKALADGNKTKALRIRRRYDKQVAKETKKKGQAAGAIEVKKKLKNNPLIP